MKRIPVEETFSWQRPIKQILTALPGAPAVGDRYVLDAPDNRIVWFAEGIWNYDAPGLGWALFNLSDFKKYIFSGVSWAAFGTILDVTESIDDVDTRIADALEQNLEFGLDEFYPVPFDPTNFAADVASGAVYTLSSIEFNRITSLMSRVHVWNFHFTGALDINANYISVVLPKGLSVAVEKQTAFVKATDGTDDLVDAYIDPTIFTNRIIFSKFVPTGQWVAGPIVIEGTFVFISD